MAKEQGITLTTNAFDRTARTVKRSESTPVDSTDQQTGTNNAAKFDGWFKIKAHLEGGGHYELSFMQGATDDIDPAANATETDFGESKDARFGKYYATYTSELDTNTHGLGIGQIVRAKEIRRQNDGTIWFGISSGGGGLPPGQYQGMHALMVTDNQAGYAFPFSHSMENITS